MKLGLQTFTVRALMKSPAQTEETFRALVGIGVRHVELAVDYLSFPFDATSAKMLADILARCGISAESCQIKYKTASENPQKTAEYMHILGAKYVTNSVIDLKLLTKGRAAVERYCAQLNALRENLLPHGIELGHHNHHYEFLKYDGKSALEWMAEYFTGDFVLDTYWCQKGGGNVLTLLEALHGRVKIMHLRDYRIEPFGLLSGGKDAEIGNGNIPFAQILKQAQAAGVLFGMVEQKTKTPMESVRFSWDTLKRITEGT